MVCTTREARFRRIHLTSEWAFPGRGCPAEAWADCADTRTIADGTEVMLGFDGSYNGDAR
jgi:hypothetical protein